MNVWIARQPIFDRETQVYGYELLFRAAENSDRFDGSDAAAATTQVLAHTFLGIGLDNVLSGRKAFVNFDRSLLTSSLHSILPRKDIVLEVLESVEAGPEVLAACRRLRGEGYTIALDDFVSRAETEPLTEFAQIVKVDLQATSRGEQQRMLGVYKPRGIAMLAEKVGDPGGIQMGARRRLRFLSGVFFCPAGHGSRQADPSGKSGVSGLAERDAARGAELRPDRDADCQRCSAVLAVTAVCELGASCAARGDQLDPPGSEHGGRKQYTALGGAGHASRTGAE
jgi:EAL and modified HD-GYP domain-containing signal transduction protein